MIDLTSTLLEKFVKHPRTPGRYNVSDLWAITNGYLDKEKFLAGEDIEFAAALRMWQGTWKHKQIQELLESQGFQTEIKIEWQHPDYGFTVVGKCDALREYILEVKTSDTVMPAAKRWHIAQGMAYCTLFDKEECHIVQPVISPGNISLKKLGTAKKNDAWFDKQMKKLNEFHKSLAWTQHP